MNDDKDGNDLPSSEADQPTDTSRRRFLGGVAVLGVGATLSACGNQGDSSGKPVERSLTPAELDKALQENVKNVVVIYGENRSFNNLFADFPGVEKPLSALKPEEGAQQDRDGSALSTLPPVWGALTKLARKPSMA